MSTLYDRLSPRKRPVVRCFVDPAKIVPSPEIMATSATQAFSPSGGHQALPRWGLPESMCVPGDITEQTPFSPSHTLNTPFSFTSSSTSSSTSSLNSDVTSSPVESSAERSEGLEGFDPVEMSFILGDEMASSELRQRRLLRRQTGVTHAGSVRGSPETGKGTEMWGLNPTQESNEGSTGGWGRPTPGHPQQQEESSSKQEMKWGSTQESCPQQEGGSIIEALLKEAVDDTEEEDMDVCDLKEGGNESDGKKSTPTTPKRNKTCDGDDDSDGSWSSLEEDEPTKQPSKRLRTSEGSDEEIEELNTKTLGQENQNSANNNKSDDDDDKEADLTNIGTFFDSEADPVFSNPAEPIKLSATEIADFRRDETESNITGRAEENSHFRSENQVGWQHVQPSRESSIDIGDDENEEFFGSFDDDDFLASSFYSITKSSTYAFPRSAPHTIENLVRFWELDFQVGDHIFPRMGAWEAADRHPRLPRDPPADCRRFTAYKFLYRKWAEECHRSKEQWYTKYRRSSLLEILNGRVEVPVQKQKADASFRSICNCDMMSGRRTNILRRPATGARSNHTSNPVNCLKNPASNSHWPRYQ